MLAGGEATPSLPWLRARLSRRIAFWIFLNFLVVEAIVLVPSVLRQAERLGQQLRQVTNAKIQWLVTRKPPDSPEALLQEVKRLQGPSMVAALSGAALYRASSGERLGGFGTAPVLRPGELTPGSPQGRWYPLAYAYDGFWGPDSLGGADVVLVIRHDDAALRRGLQTYIRNIVLIVLGIASFLTLITMLVMQRLVIGRVLLLHDHLLRSGHAFAEGMPDDPASFLIPAAAPRRPDELTDVIEAFNRSFERTSGEMERRIAAEATAQAERDRAEALLLNILPAPIAEEMKRGRHTIAETHADVTVLFADIVGFTDLSTRIDGDALVALLNRIFCRFDDLSEQHGLEKIKTIGDSYMVVGGLPVVLERHAEAVAEMALAMQAAIAAIEAPMLGSLVLRIGIHSGPVVAGVIGRRKFIYDLWGETVNVASRMESNGEPGRIQISEATWRRLAGRYATAPRGLVPIKGVGEMATYWLEGRLESLEAQPPR
ncbi:MAG: adenylate/guanylate cyclase domain-containing protein [Prochlorococcaceae cyanobacterium]